MVCCRDWMLLWLVAVNSSQASESFVDGRSVANDRLDEFLQGGDEHLGKFSGDPVLTSGHEYNEGQSLDWPTQRSSDGWPRKRLRSDRDGTTCYYDKLDENPTNKRPRISEERRAEIRRNLADHEDQLSTMRAKGEQMRRWFDFLFQNGQFLKLYSRTAKGKPISTILEELKKIRRDINEVAQIRLRKWGGLGGRVFRPECQTETAGQPLDFTGQQIELNPKSPVEQPMSIGISSQNPESRQRGVEVSDKACKVEDGSSPGKITIENMRGGQQELESKYNDISLEPVYDQLMKTRAKDLKAILDNVLFPNEETIRKFDSHREPIKVIKLCFEKSVFLAIQFMYELKFLDKITLEELFTTTNIVAIIGRHLVDLFHVVKYGIYQDPYTLIPEMEFLSNHFQTAHLHGIFSVLNQRQQCHMIYVVLKRNIKLFRDTVGLKTLHWKPDGIHQRFIDAKLLQYLELQQLQKSLNNESNGRPIAENHPMNIHTQKMIEFFQNPLPIEVGKKLTISVEYILNYYVLRFIQKYFEQYFSNLFRTQNEYETLKKQLHLLQEGIKAHDLVKQGYTHSYGFLLRNQKRELCGNLIDNAQKIRPMLHKEFIKTSYQFKRLAYQIDQMAGQNNQIDKWCQITSVSRALLNQFVEIISGTWAIEMEKERCRRSGMTDFLLKAKSRYRYDTTPHVDEFLNDFYSQSL